MSLTAEVRSELAALPLPTGDVGTMELSALLRFSGVLRRHGGPAQAWVWVSTLQSTAARRADRLVAHLYGQRCELRARRVTAPRPMLLVEVAPPDDLIPALHLDTVHRGGPPLPPLRGRDQRWAYVRGAALAGLRLSQPHRPHCEIGAPTEAVATAVAEVLARLGVAATPTHQSRDRWRVVVKSRAAIGTLLAGTGATSAYLHWEDERARHAVRGAATRGANADRANARRSVRAASAQIALAQRALALGDDTALDDDLRLAALARLANPTASMDQLAHVLDVSKTTVSRRFQRLAAMLDPDRDA